VPGRVGIYAEVLGVRRVGQTMAPAPAVPRDQHRLPRCRGGAVADAMGRASAAGRGAEPAAPRCGRRGPEASSSHPSDARPGCRAALTRTALLRPCLPRRTRRSSVVRSWTSFCTARLTEGDASVAFSVSPRAAPSDIRSCLICGWLFSRRFGAVSAPRGPAEWIPRRTGVPAARQLRAACGRWPYRDNL
jgi:hypothetical protein